MNMPVPQRYTKLWPSHRSSWVARAALPIACLALASALVMYRLRSPLDFYVYEQALIYHASPAIPACVAVVLGIRSRGEPGRRDRTALVAIVVAVVTVAMALYQVLGVVIVYMLISTMSDFH